MIPSLRPFKVLSSRIVWSCPWYRVRQDDILTPDGQPGVYNVVEKAEAVWVIPVTCDGYLAMVYQYRYTVDDWCWEIPAGSVKKEHSLEMTAIEELHEEVGGSAGELEYIGRFYLANGICNEVGHIYLATGVILGETHHEAAEVIRVHRKPIAEALRMAREGLISDGPTALALLLCAEKLQELSF
jgi:ADP-ribose pyrophosphatase